MNAIVSKWVLAVVVGVTCLPVARAGVEIGDTVKLSIRGVPNDEQQQINGVYRVSDTGGLRLPLLKERLTVRGLTADQIAAAAERAYRNAGIYQNPAIEVEVTGGTEDPGAATIVSIGGQVGKAGPVPFRKGLTLIQALQAAGDRTAFGGRNITLIRGKKAIHLDYRKAETKNLELLPDDTITVEQRLPLEIDRG